MVNWSQLIPGRRIWKTVLAATAAWEIASWLGSDHPFFAPLAAVLCMQTTIEKSLTKGFQRVLGIIIGVLLASAFLLVAVPTWWSIGVILLIALSNARALKLPEYTITQTGISALLVFTIGADSNYYGLDRILETIIGAAVATVVNLSIAPPDYTSRAADALELASKGIVRHYHNLSSWVEEGANIQVGERLRKEAGELCEDIKQASAEMEQAMFALKFSPFVRRRRSQLEQYRNMLQTVEQGYVHSMDFQRILHALSAYSGLSGKDQMHWALLFAQFANRIDDWWRQSIGSEVRGAPQQLADVDIPPLNEQYYLHALAVEAHQLLDDFGHDKKPAQDGSKSPS